MSIRNNCNNKNKKHPDLGRTFLVASYNMPDKSDEFNNLKEVKEELDDNCFGEDDEIYEVKILKVYRVKNVKAVLEEVK